MKNENELKEIVRNTYGKIVSDESKPCCVPKTCCGEKKVLSIMSEDYTSLDGYNSDADYGLGCGLPTTFAKIKKGDTVVDLGSGAGNDCFVARAEVGENGKVVGVDFTQEMIDKANENAKNFGYSNVEFIFGDIDNMPLASDFADVIVSNCVLNLVPNKKAVFKEIYRVLKCGGHFSISDIVLAGELPDKIRSVAAMYAGCISGAVEKEIYLKYIQETGFENITIQKEKTIVITDEELSNHLSKEEISRYKKDLDAVKSVTVYAEKPLNKDDCNAM